jgi:hypothetical protein
MLLLAAAQFATGNSLYESVCNPQGNRGACGMYAVGVNDATVQLEEFLKRGHAVCIPVGVPSGQIADIFGKYLETHPEKRQLPGALLALAAMKEAFPCPS